MRDGIVTLHLVYSVLWEQSVKMILLAQTVTIVKKPLCPTFIHDDISRLFICAVGILLCVGVLYFIMRYFNGTQ